MQSFTCLQDLLTSVLGVRVTICSTQEAAQGQASSTASLQLLTETGASVAVFLKIRRAGSRAEDWDRVFNLYRCTGCSIYNLYRVSNLLYTVQAGAGDVQRRAAPPGHLRTGAERP